VENVELLHSSVQHAEELKRANRDLSALYTALAPMERISKSKSCWRGLSKGFKWPPGRRRLDTHARQARRFLLLPCAKRISRRVFDCESNSGER